MADPVTQEKLESLQRCLARIRLRRPDSAEALFDDPDAQDILSLNLTRSVQLCVDIAAHRLATTELPPPDTMGQSFDQLACAKLITPELAKRMKAAVGFLNIAVHSYRSIDWTIVFAIVDQRLGDFEDFARAMLD